MATLSPLPTPSDRKPLASALTRSDASSQPTGRQPSSSWTRNAGRGWSASTARRQMSPMVATDGATMNRQSVRVQDVGRNKAAVFAERMREVNPYATVEVHDHGITKENVDDVTTRADLILDGVDVTTKTPLLHKVNLHAQAKQK